VRAIDGDGDGDATRRDATRERRSFRLTICDACARA